MTKTEKILGLGVLVAIVIATGAFLHKPAQQLSTGAASATDSASTNFTQLTTTGDVTFGGGTDALVLTTSDSATSSMTVGCINLYASTTATANRLRIIATATTIYPYTGLAVLPQYGSCP